MKTFLPCFLLAAALLATGASAQDPAPTSADRRTFHLIVVANSPDTVSARTDFDRIDLAFQYVARMRKWPLAIAAERLTAETPVHNFELRVYHEGLREDIGNEFVCRLWLTLVVRGEKQELGMVSYRYSARQWENNDDVYEKVYRGAALAAADKLEPVIFTRGPRAP